MGTASVTVPIFVKGGSTVFAPMLVALIAVVCHQLYSKVAVAPLEEKASDNISCEYARIVVAKLTVVADHVIICT